MRFKVTEKVFKEAEKEGSAREFFFKLCELLSDGELSRKVLKKLSKEEQEKVVFSLVKENGLERYFKLSDNLFASLRKAFRAKYRLNVEKEWEEKLSNWRKEFEEALDRAVVSYLLKVESREIVYQLYLKGWIVASDVVNEFKGSGEDFGEWVMERGDFSFLALRLEKWLELKPFKRREKILRDILKAYELGCLELAIYGLFPQTEGVIWDTFLKENVVEADLESLIRKRNRKFVTIQYAVKLIVEKLLGKDEIPDFLDWVRFVDYREGTLNRHAIQHGVAVNFGTKENFLRLFLFLDFLAEVVFYLTKLPSHRGG
jgi:Mor family transcriptional regulator